MKDGDPPNEARTLVGANHHCDRRLAGGMILVVAAWSVVTAFGSPAWVIDRFTVDDTYLALQVARGWAEHGFPTFDGLHRTNGFQALWGLLLWAIASCVDGAQPLVRAMLVAVALLNALAGALLLQAFVIRLWLGRYHSGTMWYYAPQNVSACVLIGYCFARMAEAGRWRRHWAIALPAAKLSLAITALFVPATIETNALNQYAAAQWLSENTAEDDRVAAWNAGHIAYFSERTVINLDGLVNDREYYGLLQRGLGGESYLLEQDVRWIVDRAEGALDKPGTVWGWLPLDEWEVVKRIGDIPALQQIVM